MTNTDILTQEEIHSLNEYFMLYAKNYYHLKREKLSTLDQILDSIRNREINLEEDIWGTYLDNKLEYLDDSVNEFFDYHIDMFQYEEYFPKEKRLPEGNGGWIKIRTPKGFEVHYAKRSTRKKRWHELISKELGSSVENLTSIEIRERREKMNELIIRNELNFQPYEVFIWRTKTKKEYYYPYQYSMVNDIESFSDAYMNSITGVTSKQLYSSNDKNAIFYLQSRGIPKKTAQIMASLKQMYFVVNMEEAMEEFDKQWHLD